MPNIVEIRKYCGLPSACSLVNDLLHTALDHPVQALGAAAQQGFRLHPDARQGCALSTTVLLHQLLLQLHQSVYACCGQGLQVRGYSGQQVLADHGLILLSADDGCLADGVAAMDTVP